MRKPLALAVALLGIAGATASHAQNWSDWERDNAVAQHRDFLVIRQPGEGFCYVKQSYDNDTSKMELSFQGDAPYIVTPFYRGIEGSIEYRVDHGKTRIVKNSEISGSNSFHLSKNVVPEIKAGLKLYVKVNPVGERSRTQSFSLLGFTAASQELNTEKCEATDAARSSDLEVDVSRQANGGVIVSGDTTLPNDMKLMVSIRRDGGGYFAQSKTQVRDGAYRSEPFMDGSNPLSSGTYQVSISSPMMDLQPDSVERALGQNGEEIPEAIREKSSFGDHFTVDHTVMVDLGG